MAQSYRQFVISTLQLEPLAITEPLSRQKQLVDKQQQIIHARMNRWLWAWILSCSLLLATLAGLLFASAWAFWVLLLLAVPVFVATLQLPPVKHAIDDFRRHSHAFVVERKLIAQAESEITRLRERAQAYQQHLEPEDSPGFLAVFSDLLTHPGFVSAFSREQRLRFVELSLRGMGRTVDIVDYSKLLFELKQASFEQYCSGENLVEQVVPQNKVDVVLAYARLLGQKSRKADADEIRFAALIGLNALSMCRQQGLPAQWRNHEHKRWEMACRILQCGFQQKTLSLIKLLPDFEALLQKQARRSLQQAMHS